LLRKRPPGLTAIVIYKVCVAVLQSIAAIAALLALNHHQALIDFAEAYTLEGKNKIIDWVLEQVSTLNPRVLQLGGIAIGLHAIVTSVEAVGLWYEKTWAKALVIGLVAISIPFEIVVLIRGVSPLKLLVFVINVAILWYLVHHFSRSRPQRS
jgi:uncharacterized membrane protein (DUF2068 family)